VNCSVGVDIIPYTSEEIEGTPFFILNLGVGGTMRLGNHHYWLDPGNTAIIGRNIAEKLAEVDLANARTIGATRNTSPCISARSSRNGTS